MDDRWIKPCLRNQSADRGRANSPPGEDAEAAISTGDTAMQAGDAGPECSRPNPDPVVQTEPTGKSGHCALPAIFVSLLAVLSLPGCAVGPSICLTPEEVSAYRPLSPPRKIRILTINVWSGLTYEGTLRMGRYRDHARRRYEALVAGIRRLDPDVIAIQEANPLPHYVERLAADLGYRSVCRVALGGIRLGPVGIPRNLREGEAILVKRPWTVTELDSKRLAGWGIATNWFCLHFSEITQAVLCRVIVNGKMLYVYNVHLHSGPFRGPALSSALEDLSDEFSEEELADARERIDSGIRRRTGEIAELEQFIEKTLPRGMPAVIMGDFNTSARSGALDPLLADGRWIDSFRLVNPDEAGATWDPEHNPNCRLTRWTSDPFNRLTFSHESHPHRIDFILLSGNIPAGRIVDSRVVLNPAGGVYPSDHYGVMTTLRW